MCLERSTPIRPARQRGIGLPGALFVIVVLALVVLGLSELQQGETQSFNFELMSTRAFFAAESAAQIGIHDLIPPSTGVTTSCASVPASIGFPAGTSSKPSGLAGCSATLTCSVVTVSAADHFTLTATGACGNGIDAASRVVEVRVR